MAVKKHKLILKEMKPTKTIHDIFKTTKIWQYYSKKNPSGKLIVDKLTKDALGLLDKINETFPTYTLHNGQHQLNILNLYEKILGERIIDLTALETEILILSAFYHDIGMVFKESEKENLKEEPNFGEFLEQNGRAKLEYLQAGTITKEIAEWYCRWSHARRVWQFLAPINDQLLFDGNNIREALGNVCLSHNESIDYIKGDKLNSDYWDHSDQKFCALILRIADVLDFDDSRAPLSVYHYMELDNPQNGNELLSSVEYQKHMVSKGFSFTNWNQNANYSIDYRALPDNPTIEHEIYKYLNYIETELKECATSLIFCSSRWINFKLPNNINRKNVISQGYKFGDFKFSLDQDHVMSLLMGESLYNDNFIFLRELIQNAIDTTRHRKFYESAKKTDDYSSSPIEVATWHDDQGYRWVSIDDFGMGMTETQISNYFLRIGVSYYNSTEFKLEKLSYKSKDVDFTPISRFGIGILSCFIVGDCVEMNTRSVFAESRVNNQTRLSLKGIDNYYVLQRDPNLPSPMPNRITPSIGYRKDFGTTISVRIKPNYDLPDLNISEILDRFLFNPDVPIKVIDVGIKGRYKYELESDDLDLKVFKPSQETLRSIQDALVNTVVKTIDPEIQILPISLNKYFSYPLIKGLLYILILKPNIEVYQMSNVCYSPLLGQKS